MKKALAILALAAGCAGPGGTQDKVVYHFSDGPAPASNGLRHNRKHPEVHPHARHVVG